MEDVLVPIVLFVLVFSIPIVAIVSDGRTKRERMRAVQKSLEAGVPLEQIHEAFGDSEGRSRRARRPYHKGLITLAVGAALLVARALMLAGDGGRLEGEHASGLLIAGVICSFLGVAMVVGDYLNRGERKDPKDR